jgi:hypothetical protein
LYTSSWLLSLSPLNISRGETGTCHSPSNP